MSRKQVGPPDAEEPGTIDGQGACRMKVVMVHGFLNTGRLFRALCRRLESHGHVCHAPTFHPRDGRSGLPDLAEKLASFLKENVAPSAPVALVGFSMGALVARYYLQALGGVRSTKAFFSIAGPYRGSLNAYLYPGAGTRQMRPGSPFIRALDASSNALGTLPVYTYRTPLDLMTIPSRTSRIASAPELTVWCPLHSMLPRDPQVIEHIAGVLANMGAGETKNSEPPQAWPRVV
jgi:triacylglycerol lipase